MRVDAQAVDLVAPHTLAEALALLAADPTRRPLAGGTDLMVLNSVDKLPTQKLVGLWKLDELRGISVSHDEVRLGALTTYSEVQAHPTLRAEFTMLVQAAAETGGLAIQNRGTLGGNLANASPAADSSPPLHAYDAELELASPQGTRRVAYRDFHTGYKKTLLAPGELIVAIILPRVHHGRVHFFRKVGPRRAQAISKLCLAVCLDPTRQLARVALGGVGPTVMSCPKTAAALLAGDEAGVRAALAAEITPIDDHRSTARYRLRVAQNLAAWLVSSRSKAAQSNSPHS